MILGVLAMFSVSAWAHNSNSWENWFQRLNTKKQIIKISSDREYSPAKIGLKVVQFKGTIEIPRELHLARGKGAAGAAAAQLIFDNSVICNYSPSHNHRVYVLTDCSDGSRADDDQQIRKDIVLKFNVAASDVSKSTIVARIKVKHVDEVEYGIIFPYLNPTEGQVLAFNGVAWVPTDIDDLGLTGLQGPKGDQGLPGLPGPQGATGAQGLPGKDGAVGPMGPQGEQGLPGAPGLPGLQGPQGLPGVAGADGAQGPAGMTGATGPQGPKGDQGLAGTSGGMGPQGVQGPQGLPGLDGLDGLPGEKGEQGLQGLPGVKGDPGMNRVVTIRDEKPSGTQGGTCSINVWMNRDLNTMEGDTGFVTLSGSRFTLQPGKYFIEVHAPGYGVALFRTKLANVTAGNDALVGGSAQSHPTSSTLTYSIALGEIELTASTTFQVQQRCAAEKLTVGLGIASNFGLPEIYTQVKIVKTE